MLGRKVWYKRYRELRALVNQKKVVSGVFVQVYSEPHTWHIVNISSDRIIATVSAEGVWLQSKSLYNSVLQYLLVRETKPHYGMGQDNSIKRVARRLHKKARPA